MDTIKILRMMFRALYNFIIPASSISLSTNSILTAEVPVKVKLPDINQRLNIGLHTHAFTITHSVLSFA